jgi:thymidylate synthase
MNDLNTVEITKPGCRDISDAWFQLLFKILEEGRVETIDRGSYAGQKRLEFDYVTVKINYPGTTPLLPQIPEQYGIPNPVADDYLDEYLPYLMTDTKEPGEDYTYGERLVAGAILYDKSLYAPYDIYGGEVNQIQTVIDTYNKYGHRNNQMILQVGQPGDILLEDPPCLRHIDTRIQNRTLHFFVYFRSWDLWGGFPANLAAIEMLKQYMAAEIGVQNGQIIAASKGLHLYDYTFDMAKCLRMKDDMILKGE